jgi:hypothetical protein
VTRRSRALAGALFVCLHLALLAPLANNDAPLVEGEYRAAGEAVLDGSKPYSDLDWQFVTFLLARNALLLVYLGLLLRPLWRGAGARVPRPRPVAAG